MTKGRIDELLTARRAGLALVVGLVLTVTAATTRVATELVTPPVTAVLGEHVVREASLSTPANFSVTGAQPGPVLAPGRTSALVVQVHNPFTVAITVTSLSVTLIRPSTSCGAENFTVNGVAAGSAVIVPGTWLVPGQSERSVSIPVAMVDTGASQGGCQGVTLQFRYGGRARYTDSTAITLTVSPVPVAEPAAVTLTAGVSSTYTDGRSPGGSLSFDLCTTSSCTSYRSLGTAAITGGAATLVTTALPVGTDYVRAGYAGSATDFAATGSQVVPVVVTGSCVTTPTATATVVVSSTYPGSYEVRSGQSLWLDGGTIAGDVTVDAGGQLAAVRGSIDGNVTAAGSVWMQATNVRGSVHAAAPLSLGVGVNVGGDVRVGGGNQLCVDGAVIGGTLLAQGLTGVALSSVCATTIRHDLLWQSTSTPVELGSAANCGPVTVGGTLRMLDNSGRLTIGGDGYGNVVAGAIVVQDNAGGGSLTANTSTGSSCSLGGDVPAIIGEANQAKTFDTCNGSA